MTDIQKGIPDIIKSNSNFKKGREAARDLLNAGPGHHTVAEFNNEQTEDIRSFVNGARYVQRSNSTIKVARRTDKSSGVSKVYIVNEG